MTLVTCLKIIGMTYLIVQMMNRTSIKCIMTSHNDQLKMINLIVMKQVQDNIN